MLRVVLNSKFCYKFFKMVFNLYEWPYIFLIKYSSAWFQIYLTSYIYFYEVKAWITLQNTLLCIFFCSEWVSEIKSGKENERKCENFKDHVVIWKMSFVPLLWRCSYLPNKQQTVAGIALLSGVEPSVLRKSSPGI